MPDNIVVTTELREGGEGWVMGVLNKVLYCKALPRGPTPYPFIHPFWKKRYPFRIYYIDQCYPFHIPSLEFCIAFNCCKGTVNNNMNISQNQNVFSTFSQQ